MWGTYLHRKATIQFGYKRKQENKVKLTYHYSFIRQWILACRVLHLHSHPSVCFVCMLIDHSLPSAFLQNNISILIILIQFYCLISTKYLLKSNSVICWSLLTDIFARNSKYVIYTYMTIAFAYGEQICIERYM